MTQLYPTPEANCNTLSVALDHVDNAETYARASQDLDVEASCVGAPDSIASLAARYALQMARDWLATEAYYVACQDEIGFAIHDVFAHLDDARTDALRAARECMHEFLILQAGRIVERVAAPEKLRADDYRSLGNFSEHPYASIPMRCDTCRVTWQGCAAASDCPECGAGVDYHALVDANDFMAAMRPV